MPGTDAPPKELGSFLSLGRRELRSGLDEVTDVEDMEDFLRGGGGGCSNPSFDLGSSSVVLTSSELLLAVGTWSLATALFAPMTLQYSGGGLAGRSRLLSRGQAEGQFKSRRNYK